MVRGIDDDVKAKIKQRAEKQGRSMEEEVRRILRDATKDSARPTVRLGSRIASLFSTTGLKEDPPELRGQAPRPSLIVIVLDTNVLSGLMRRVPEPAVIAWLDLQSAESIWITTITVFETRMGLALLPGGQRRKTLESGFSRLVDDLLDGRVLDFDRSAADAAAEIAARRSRAGRSVDVRDTQIAGIVLARRATLATRNGKYFSDLSIDVVNPWNAQSPFR